MKKFLVFGFLLLSSITNAYEGEMSSYQENKPVMIIRLNQKNIYYVDGLKKVVEKAQNIKLDTKFIVTSYAKTYNDKVASDKSKEIASKNGNKIAHDIIALGVNKENVRLELVESKDIATNEIHISVE